MTATLRILSAELLFKLLIGKLIWLKVFQKSVVMWSKMLSRYLSEFACDKIFGVVRVLSAHLLFYIPLEAHNIINDTN